MIKEYTRSHAGVLGFEFSERLDDKDYENFVPLVDEAIAEEGQVRILVHFHGFAGWDISGFWRDVRFTTKHYSSVERFAIVGESSWQSALTQLAKPLTRATVRYFNENESQEAWAWLERPDLA